MVASQNCINLIKLFEGYKPKAYLCPAGVPTIGYGSTMYQTGLKIKLSDTINEQQANELLMWELKNKAYALHGLKINQNQFDALLYQKNLVVIPGQTLTVDIPYVKGAHFVGYIAAYRNLKHIAWKGHVGIHPKGISGQKIRVFLGAHGLMIKTGDKG